jgi:hypothetical protein
MKIEALTTFMSGSDRFEAGDIRSVPDAFGAGVCASGWARDITGQVGTGAHADGSVDLAIHHSIHQIGDSNG